VLLGAVGIVPSGAQSSCYQVHAEPATRCFNARFSPRNQANKKYFVFLLTRRQSRVQWTTRSDSGRQS